MDTDFEIARFRREVKKYAYEFHTDNGVTSGKTFTELIFRLSEGRPEAMESAWEMTSTDAALTMILKEKDAFNQWFMNKKLLDEAKQNQ